MAPVAVTDMMSSRIVKQAIVQWINTGFIELIASARFSTASNITNGRFGAGFYNDFTQVRPSRCILRALSCSAWLPTTKPCPRRD